MQQEQFGARKLPFEDIAVLFLASDDGSLANDSEFIADGGLPQIQHDSGAGAVRIDASRPYPDPATTGEYAMQWEYKIVTETMNADQLNEFGAEGWELVMVVSPAHFVFHYFFKRELRE